MHGRLHDLHRRGEEDVLDVLHAHGRAIRRFDLGAGPVSTSGHVMKGPADNIRCLRILLRF